MNGLESEAKWICGGCGRQLHPSDLVRVGIGVHHYDQDKDQERNGMLNCGLVKQVSKETQKDVTNEVVT